MYYRYTNSNNPMSDWGHAMLTDRQDRVGHYGNNGYTYDGKDAVNIEDLRDEIIAIWDDQEDDRPDGYDYLTGEQVADSCNPEDIVNGAEAYDCELVVWLWDQILCFKDIKAVLTDNGAVVFDADLLKKI